MRSLQKKISVFFLLTIVMFIRPTNAKAHILAVAPGVKRVISFTTLNSVKLEVTFDALPPANGEFFIRITDDKTKRAVFDKAVQPTAIANEENKLIFTINNLVADAWMPTNPKLYQLTFTQKNGAEIVEEEKQRIGFRFFESKEGNLYLNGHPIFLRGIAINPPGRGIPDSIESSRKFAEEYVGFMKSIHVNIIRIPDANTWYDVCDEMGMMVFGGNYSGLVDGAKPPANYDKAVAWYKNEKFAPIAHHPSLMVYAMTNEVDYTGSEAEPWLKFLRYAHEKLLQWDNTRAYIGNAGYGYGLSGDICDLHRYWGWYYNSPFTFLHVRYNEDIIPFKKPVQPVTFTECVGNYTGPDGRYNLTPDHKNPGSQLNWTGHADWSMQTNLANEHQSFTFKTATELFRRLRTVNPELSGIFPFTILFYNWNTVDRFVDMGPKPVTAQAKLSYQPVLLSWENWRSNVYANTNITPNVHIVNDADDFSDITNAKLVYQLLDETKQVLITDTIALPVIKYYSAWQQTLSIHIPAQLAAGNYQLTGKVITGKRTISENYDKLFIGNEEMISSAVKPIRTLLVYDPAGATTLSLDKMQLPYKKIISVGNIPVNSLLLVGENGIDANLTKQSSALKQFVSNGGRLIFLRQDSAHFAGLNALLNYDLKNVTVELDQSNYPPQPRPSRNGYYVNPERPDHPVFAGIDRENLKVWSDYTNWNERQQGFPAIYPVTDGFVPVNKKDIEHIAVLGNYGVALEGITLAEIFEGKGSAILCGLDFVRRSQLDPVADRILMNILGYMGNTEKHENYPLITAPIVWGDYKTEKGILTGVNSGLLLNSKPRLTESFSKVKLTITKDGHELAGSGGGFNTKPGLQYVAYGRRPFGPYKLRSFGNVPEADTTHGNIGEGMFWCSIPPGKNIATTIAWNPADVPLMLTVIVNGRKATKAISAGAKEVIDCAVNATTIEMHFSGDRRLVLLQTAFK